MGSNAGWGRNPTPRLSKRGWFFVISPVTFELSEMGDSGVPDGWYDEILKSPYYPYNCRSLHRARTGKMRTERAFAAGATLPILDDCFAQIATFAKSSDLAAWRALPAAGAKGKAALRRTCSREHL